jgi:hypothetical protein
MPYLLYSDHGAIHHSKIFPDRSTSLLFRPAWRHQDIRQIRQVPICQAQPGLRNSGPEDNLQHGLPLVQENIVATDSELRFAVLAPCELRSKASDFILTSKDISLPHQKTHWQSINLGSARCQSGLHMTMSRQMTGRQTYHAHTLIDPI